MARQTRRVLVMADGRIVREDIIGSPLEEDLKMWQHSGLGQGILPGEAKRLNNFKISPAQARALRALLNQVEQLNREYQG